MTAERERKLESLKDRIPEKPEELFENLDVRRLSDRLQEIESRRDSDLNKMRADKAAGIERTTEILRARREETQKLLDSAKLEVLSLNKLLSEEVTSARNFTKRRDATKRLKPQIEKAQARVATFEEELSRLNKAEITPDPELESRFLQTRLRYDRELEKLSSELEQLEAEVLEHLGDAKANYEKQMEDIRMERLTINRTFDNELDAVRNQMEREQKTIHIESNQRISALRESMLSEGELQLLIGELQTDLEELENKNSKQIADVNASLQPILYYRLAQWFEETAELPSIESYVQAQRLVFMPIGLFYGLVSIALAYVGASLQIQAWKRDGLPGEMKLLQRELAEKDGRIELITRRLMLEKKSLEQVQAVIDKLERELVSQKCASATAIAGIPQVIRVQAE